MVVGYFTNQYPKVSHTFIRREIQALEAAGTAVERWALRGWDMPLADEADRREQQRTRFILERGVLPLIAACAALLVTRPGRLLRQLGTCLRLMHRSDRSAMLHVVSLMEGAWLARQLRAAGVDHLHAHFGTNAAEVALHAAALAAVPWSFTVHGPDEFDRPLATHLGLKIAAATFVVAITPFCASQLFRWCDPSQWRKIEVVRCGLSGEFLGADALPPVDAPHFVNVGRLAGVKGQLLLIEAVALARSRGAPVTLTLVGDGESRPALEAAIAGHQLGSHVTITGWADEERVRREIGRARALVLSSFAEGLPIVVMEAMALGRPVLATNVAAMAELVIPGRTGWLFTPGSVQAIAQALKECADTPVERLAAMGAAGQALVRDRHDARREAATLARLFAHPPVHRPVKVDAGALS